MFFQIQIGERGKVQVREGNAMAEVKKDTIVIICPAEEQADKNLVDLPWLGKATSDPDIETRTMEIAWLHSSSGDIEGNFSFLLCVFIREIGKCAWRI